MRPVARTTESRYSRNTLFTLVLALFTWLAVIQPLACAQIKHYWNDQWDGGLTGSAIVGAKVSITNSATGAASDTVTNSNGSFSQVGLTPDNTKSRSRTPGFSTFKETGIAWSLRAFTFSRLETRLRECVRSDSGERSRGPW